MDSAGLIQDSFKKGRQIGIMPNLAEWGKGSRGDDAEELISLNCRITVPEEKVELPWNEDYVEWLAGGMVVSGKAGSTVIMLDHGWGINGIALIKWEKVMENWKFSVLPQVELLSLKEKKVYVYY